MKMGESLEKRLRKMALGCFLFTRWRRVGILFFPAWCLVPGSDPFVCANTTNCSAGRRGWHPHCRRPPDDLPTFWTRLLPLDFRQCSCEGISWSNLMPAFLSEASPTGNSSSSAEVGLVLNNSPKQQACNREMKLAAHLGIAQHDHPHQHHVDVNSQRLVVVNLIHLETEKDNQPDCCWQRNNISFRAASPSR